MWELDYKESWAQKNWWFWTVVLEKTLASSLDCKESNQSILKEISPEYSLEGLMTKLKLQHFGQLMIRNDSMEKTLMLGKIEGKRRGWQRMKWLNGITDSMDMIWASFGSWWWTGRPGMLQSMGSQSGTRLSDWTELKDLTHLFIVNNQLPDTTSLKNSSCTAGGFFSVWATKEALKNC